jgi:mannose-6-phosphate isomerase class I
MEYTQDESYYLLDAAPHATVWLGLKTGIDPQQMIGMLHQAHDTGGSFDPSGFVNLLPAKKHDHFLIPAGTIHCSGRDCMVLEISATPYIFTFKMWDWDRPGLDGKPRPINLDHAANVIRWERDTQFVKTELVNKISSMSSGDGWREERTGLHQSEFIETRRHWFTKKVIHSTYDTVNVLNLVEGSEAIVESPGNLFEPFVVHYAETLIVPAAVKEYTIRPSGKSEGLEIATIKAFVRI